MTGPKEGIYLDAALAVIGEQLEERIDELSRRRRTRRRFGIAALSVFALASGSVAAVALSTARDAEQPVAVVMSAEHVVQCVEGESAVRDAYFTIRYRAAEGAGVDQLHLCGQAWSALASDSTVLRAATPEELIGIAAGYVSAAAPDAGTAVSVSDAAFGRLTAGGEAPAMIPCERGDSTLVLTPSVVPSAPADRVLFCAQAGS